MRLFTLICVVACTLQSAWAVSEKILSTAYTQEILPYFQSEGLRGEFEGVDNVRIQYAVFGLKQETLGAIVLIPGRTEFILEYAELIYDLRNSGYSLYILDHRGQGNSGRWLRNPEKGHVNKFEDYVTDLDTFMTRVVHAREHQKIFALSHSMGGAVASLYAMRHPEALDAMVLSAPMIEINGGAYSEVTMMTLSRAAIIAGFGTSYAPGRGDNEWNVPFEKNQVTTSRKRYSVLMDAIKTDPKHLGLGGPTYQWVNQAVHATRWLRSRAIHLRTPMLLLQAGNDKIVKKPAQTAFCAATTNCRKIEFPGAMHDLLLETDVTRDRVITEMLAFFGS